MADETIFFDGTEQRRSVRAAPAWWYPDPAKRHDLRFWTGEAWSEFVIDGPTRTPSVDPLVSANLSTAVAAPVESLPEAAAARVESPQGAAAAAEPVGTHDLSSESTAIPPRSKMRSRLMLVALVVVLVLIAVAGAYLVLGGSSDGSGAHAPAQLLSSALDHVT
jgi:hypothetical protein